MEKKGFSFVISKQICEFRNTLSRKERNAMYQIIKKEILNPTVTRMKIHAPFVAAKAQPGQFIILRTDEKRQTSVIKILNTH